MRKLFVAAALAAICATAGWAAGYTTATGIPYRTAAKGSYADRQCRLDVSYANGAYGKPVIVWFHGGGLKSGDKATPEELLRKDYTVVSVQYRMLPEVPIDTIIDDAAAAVAWAFRHAAGYGGDTTRIFVAGHSAGGYLTSMVGLDKSRLGRHGIDADRIAGIAPLSGQAVTHYEWRKMQGLSPNVPTIDSTAPISHIRKGCPPVLIVSGDRELELLGRYEEQAYFWRMLRLIGNKDVTLYELDGFGHVPMLRPAYTLLLDFVEKHSK